MSQLAATGPRDQLPDTRQSPARMGPSRSRETPLVMDTPQGRPYRSVRRPRQWPENS